MGVMAAHALVGRGAPGRTVKALVAEPADPLLGAGTGAGEAAGGPAALDQLPFAGADPGFGSTRSEASPTVPIESPTPFSRSRSLNMKGL